MAVADPRDNHSTFTRCWNEGDIDGLVALYEEGAVYVAGPDQLLQGHAAIRSMLEAATKMGKNRLELLSLAESGDIALEKTQWTMAFEGEDGEVNEQSGFSTVVLRRGSDGCWRMIIDDPGLG